MIDHSVQVDEFGTPQAFDLNAALEFQRNQERYSFLRWGQKALKNFAIVPPDTGIVHQINIEYLARVVFVLEQAGKTPVAYPDTVVGTDSHTTMVNGLGVLGWGVGGIEAEAAMLGQAVFDADSAGCGRALYGQAARGLDGDRPGADGGGGAAQKGRGGQVCGVLWAEPGIADGGRPHDDCEYGVRSMARPAASSRWTRRRCAT